MSGASDGRLRILAVPAWYPTGEQPMAGLFIRDQVRAVAVRHDVVVIADGGPEEMGSLYRLHDALEERVRTIRVTHRPAPLASAGYVLGVLAAVRALRRDGWRPDIVHAHVYYTGLVAALIRLRHRAPVVLSEHSSHFLLGTLRPADRLRARIAFARADLVCPVSDGLAAALRGLGVRTQLQVVPNAVDTSAFTAGPQPAEPPVRAVTVAGLHTIKDIPTLLRALSRVDAEADSDKLVLDIVGDGPERRALERLSAELGLAGRVTFHGYQPRAIVAERLARGHFVVLSSRVETFGVALVEGLAAGRPFLATRVGVAVDLEGEDLGIVVAPASVDALAAGLQEMARAHRGYPPDRLAAAAHARYGPAAVAARWDEVYRSLLAPTR